MKNMKKYCVNICDWIWSGEMPVSVFRCPACFEDVMATERIPKYCSHCGFKFSNGGITIEDE